jgi:hypothetical protein
MVTSHGTRVIWWGKSPLQTQGGLGDPGVASTGTLHQGVGAV